MVVCSGQGKKDEVALASSWDAPSSDQYVPDLQRQTKVCAGNESDIDWPLDSPAYSHCNCMGSHPFCGILASGGLAFLEVPIIRGGCPF